MLKSTQGPAGYQEVGCGTLSFYNAEREYLESLRFGRMPEATKATLKDTLSAEVEAILARRPELTLVNLADGAHDNWTYRLKDFFHATEHYVRERVESGSMLDGGAWYAYGVGGGSVVSSEKHDGQYAVQVTYPPLDQRAGREDCKDLPCSQRDLRSLVGEVIAELGATTSTRS